MCSCILLTVLVTWPLWFSASKDIINFAFFFFSFIKLIYSFFNNFTSRCWCVPVLFRFCFRGSCVSSRFHFLILERSPLRYIASSSLIQRPHETHFGSKKNPLWSSADSGSLIQKLSFRYLASAHIGLERYAFGWEMWKTKTFIFTTGAELLLVAVPVHFQRGLDQNI